MSRRFSRRLGTPEALPRNTVITVAVILAAASLVFLVWSVTTRSAARLAWLTSMATILAVVLSSWGMSAGMLTWAVRSRRKVSHSGVDDVRGPDNGQVVVGEIPREPAGFQQRAMLQSELTATGGVTVLSAVTGARGIGKTHLAAAVARRRIDGGWPVVAWIVAEDYDQVLSGMERLARALHLTAPEEDSNTAARSARAWLETRASAQTLVVFDNAPDPAVVRRWLPAVGRAHIIVTSTNRACEDLGTPVRVGAFTEVEAADFLAARTGLNGAFEVNRDTVTV